MNCTSCVVLSDVDNRQTVLEHKKGTTGALIDAYQGQRGKELRSQLQQLLAQCKQCSENKTK